MISLAFQRTIDLSQASWSAAPAWPGTIARPRRGAGPCSCLAHDARWGGPFTRRQELIKRLLVLGSFLGQQGQQHFVPILVTPGIALALRDQMPIVRMKRSIYRLHGLLRASHHRPERRPKVSKTAHPPQFIFAETARAQGDNCAV